MLYRIDTFVLPEPARRKFVEVSRCTIEVLRTQPGFVRHQWFEKISGAGSVDVVTIVEWRDAQSIKSAAQAVRTLHAEMSFDAAAFARMHGILESKAVYAERQVGSGA